MKKKIVLLVSSLRRSGPIVVVQNLLRNINRKKFSVHIIKLMADEQTRSITSEFINDDIPVHELNSSKLMIELFPNLVINRLRGLVDNIKPDLIHTHGYQACMLGARLSKQYRVVETLHCIASEDFISSKGPILGRYMLYRYLRNLNKIHGAAAISETVKEYYASKLDRVKIQLVYNGVALNRCTIPKTNIRNVINDDESTVVFLVIGTLSKRKDPLTIIRAFKKAFPTDERSVRLYFLGKGNLHDECEAEINGDKRIKLLGWKPNVADYLDASNYTISASHSEGFGLNFIESISAGVPVIGSDIPPFREFYNIFKKLQILMFRVGDEDELAGIMKNAVNLKIDMSEYSKIASDLFSAKTMARNYETFYNHMISVN